MGAKEKLRWAKSALWSWGFGGWAWWIWSVASGSAGANAAEWLQAKSGWQAVAWLAASLMASPLARFAQGMGWLMGARRLAGLWACAMATAHGALWLGLEQGFDVGEAWRALDKPAYVIGGRRCWFYGFWPRVRELGLRGLWEGVGASCMPCPTWRRAPRCFTGIGSGSPKGGWTSGGGGLPDWVLGLRSNVDGLGAPSRASEVRGKLKVNARNGMNNE